MSEPKLISPLLSDYLMGEPISNHHGICCCPAIKKDSEDKYIVKILSIPASQVQLDALLLTGAYADKDAALSYFKELADAAEQEAQILKKLSEIEGFCGYEAWQTVPMEDAIGYDVYLLGVYRPTLEWYFKSNPITHLAAVNLGLDLCAALSACRRNGYLYVDLKPGNIFITGNQEYRIGDLGFVSLDSLKYASLPDKYRSAYTAPEIADAYSSLNSTLDIYAAGLILYQAYNNGLLPALDEEESLPPPAYADYEMAQIILKACAKDPADRWQDPAEMGQELVEYMQRNSVNDVPILPAAVAQITDEEEIEEESAEETETEEIADVEPAEEAEAEETVDVESAEETEAEETVDVESAKETEAEEIADAESEEEPYQEEQFVIEGFEIDETAPTEDDLQALEDTAVTEETSNMLAQADELLAHETPAPVVVPEPIEVSLPEPENAPEDTEEPTQESPCEENLPSDAEETELTSTISVRNATEIVKTTEEKTYKKHNPLVVVLSTILILLLLAAGAFYFYENYYVQLVQNITVTSDSNVMTVTLDTEVDNELLTVICQDIYGNKLTADVVDNQATFSGITSNTHYKITVEVSGFHRLVGTTTTNHTTDSLTNIVSFTGISGDQDGSVVLNFSVQGEDNFAWRIYYSTPGEDEKVVECNGHMATVTGLTVGSTYTFRLAPVIDIKVTGSDTFTYTATSLIYPQNLTIKGFRNGLLQVAWSAPKGFTVNSWTVRCYNNEGFNETYTVTEPKISIEGLDTLQSYTVDVKAENMTVSKWVNVTANSVTFTDIQLDNSNPEELKITWKYEGKAPAEGWRLLYTIDGGDKQVILCKSNSCTISPLVPGGSYVFSFELPADITVFGGKAKFDVPESGSFNSYGVSSKNFSFRMCHTPDNPAWRWYNLYEKDFTTTYKVGEKASFIFRVDKAYEKSEDEIKTLFVIRDADGKVVSVTPGRTRIWGAMWNDNYSELDIPAMPQNAGKYSVEIYFNGALLTTQDFTVTK